MDFFFAEDTDADCARINILRNSYYEIEKQLPHDLVPRPFLSKNSNELTFKRAHINACRPEFPSAGFQDYSDSRTNLRCFIGYNDEYVFAEEIPANIVTDTPTRSGIGKPIISEVYVAKEMPTDTVTMLGWIYDKPINNVLYGMGEFAEPAGQTIIVFSNGKRLDFNIYMNNEKLTVNNIMHDIEDDTAIGSTVTNSPDYRDLSANYMFYRNVLAQLQEGVMAIDEWYPGYRGDTNRKPTEIHLFVYSDETMTNKVEIN